MFTGADDDVRRLDPYCNSSRFSELVAFVEVGVVIDRANGEKELGVVVD